MEIMGKNRELLTGLQAQVEAIRQGRKTPEDFYRFGRVMEAGRDHISGYLNGLPTNEERGAAEDQLSPAIHVLVEKIDELTNQAVKDGIILANGQLRYDLGMLGVSLMFVTGFTKLVIEAPEQIKPRRRC